MKTDGTPMPRPWPLMLFLDALPGHLPAMEAFNQMQLHITSVHAYIVIHPRVSIFEASLALGSGCMIDVTYRKVAAQLVLTAFGTTEDYQQPSQGWADWVDEMIQAAKLQTKSLCYGVAEV